MARQSRREEREGECVVWMCVWRALRDSSLPWPWEDGRASERTDGRTNGRMTTTVVGGRQARVRGMIGAQAARACRARDRCELGLVSGPRGCYPLARSLARGHQPPRCARPPAGKSEEIRNGGRPHCWQAGDLFRDKRPLKSERGCSGPRARTLRLPSVGRLFSIVSGFPTECPNESH